MQMNFFIALRASRAALVHLTKSLAQEFGPQGIRVSAPASATSSTAA
jgi:NAD(P)-dependent dehydrogenase (short-subunit alcohol dehydrogenase family)